MLSSHPHLYVTSSVLLRFLSLESYYRNSIYDLEYGSIFHFDRSIRSYSDFIHKIGITLWALSAVKYEFSKKSIFRRKVEIYMLL